MSDLPPLTDDIPENELEADPEHDHLITEDVVTPEDGESE